VGINYAPQLWASSAKLKCTVMDTDEKGIQWIGFEEPSLELEP